MNFSLSFSLRSLFHHFKILLQLLSSLSLFIHWEECKIYSLQLSKDECLKCKYWMHLWRWKRKGKRKSNFTLSMKGKRYARFKCKLITLNNIKTFNTLNLLLERQNTFPNLLIGTKEKWFFVCNFSRKVFSLISTCKVEPGWWWRMMIKVKKTEKRGEQD